MNEETKQKSAIKRLGEQIVGVFGWVRGQWQTNPLPSIVVVILLLLLAWIIWETRKVNNLGLGNKTFWDWMELLIIPIVLAIGAWWLNKSEKETEREIAKEKRNQDTMEAYFDRMGELLLEYDLIGEKLEENEESEEKGMPSIIARTRTLAVLRSLDGNRKGQVIQFLYESGLIGPEQPVVDLSGADLGGAILHEADLSGAILHEADLGGAILHEANLYEANLYEANLYEANLGGANLTGANLNKANLSRVYLSHAGLSDAILYRANLMRASLIGANLSKANLSRAHLSRAYLSGAILYEANLRGANLGRADLGGANLGGANLRGAKLRGANLRGAYLRGAGVTDKQLAQAKSLAGATLPDGTKVPDEATADEQD